jgi:hypothetical protein
MKKLKGEIKRLRQELIMKGTSNNRRGGKIEETDGLSDDSELDEEERAAVRMMSPDVRKVIAELEQAGANKSYIKKKIRQSL